MGGNYSIVSPCIMMQRKPKEYAKDQRRLKSLSESFVMFKKGPRIGWNYSNDADNNKILLKQ